MSLNGKSILIIDDDIATYSALHSSFTDAGATVIAAGTHDEGLAAISAQKPDIVIIDLMLPGQSGFEVLKDAQALPAPHPFFVILTNSVNVTQMAEAIQAGVSTYIQKAEHDPAEIAKLVSDRYAAARPDTVA